MKETKINLNDKKVTTVAGEVLSFNNDVIFNGTVYGLPEYLKKYNTEENIYVSWTDNINGYGGFNIENNADTTGVSVVQDKTLNDVNINISSENRIGNIALYNNIDESYDMCKATNLLSTFEFNPTTNTTNITKFNMLSSIDDDVCTVCLEAAKRVNNVTVAHTKFEVRPTGLFLNGVAFTGGSGGSDTSIDDTTASLTTVYSSQKVTTLLATKQNTITGAATTVLTNNLTASRVVVSDSGGKIATASITHTKLNFLTDVTSNIQAQINGKAATTHTHTDMIKSVNSTLPDANGNVNISFDTSTFLEKTGGTVTGKLAIGNSVTEAKSNRALNLISTDAVMKIERVGVPGSADVALELIQTSTQDVRLSYWDMYLNGTEDSYNIRNRTGGGAGVEKIIVTPTLTTFTTDVKFNQKITASKIEFNSGSYFDSGENGNTVHIHTASGELHMGAADAINTNFTTTTTKFNFNKEVNITGGLIVNTTNILTELNYRPTSAGSPTPLSNFWSGTQAQYDALVVKFTSTIYFII